MTFKFVLGLLISFCIINTSFTMEKNNEQDRTETPGKIQSPKPVQRGTSLESGMDQLKKENFENQKGENNFESTEDQEENENFDSTEDREEKEDLRKNLRKSGSAPALLAVWVSSPCGRTRDVEALPLQNPSNPESTNQYNDLFP